MQVLHNTQIRFNVIGEAKWSVPGIQIESLVELRRRTFNLKACAPCYPGNSFCCLVAMPKTVSRNWQKNKGLNGAQKITFLYLHVLDGTFAR